MRKIAMLVTNDTFPEDSSIPPLRFTQNDASELKEILDDPETCGFETKIYLNESSQKVLADLEQISGELQSDDTLLFYYAGHGKLRRDGQLCLASKDTTMANLGARSIRAREVLNYLQESHARRRVLILDCCQSGAIGREFRGDDLQSSLAGLADSFGSYILTASTAIQLAEEREKDGHGVFAKALIDCLRVGSRESITINDWYEYACSCLKGVANQTPLKWGLQEQGRCFEIGNFRAKHKRLRREEEDQLISTAGVKLNALVVSGALTEPRFKSAMRLLESDEATLFPYEQERRDRLKRYLKGELDLFDAFGNLPAQVPPEPPVVDRPVTPPKPLVFGIFKDPDKRAILSWLGGGAIVVAAGMWWFFPFVVEHKDARDKTGGTAAVIIGPTKEQTEQIQKPPAEPTPVTLPATKPPQLTVVPDKPNPPSAEQASSNLPSTKHGDAEKKPTARPVEKALGMEFSSLTDDLRQKFGIKNNVDIGVVVTDVDPYSSAAEKHVEAGDVLVEINQEPVKEPADIAKKIQALKSAGKKSALLRVANGQGEVHFVGLALPLEDNEKQALPTVNSGEAVKNVDTEQNYADEPEPQSTGPNKDGFPGQVGKFSDWQVVVTYGEKSKTCSAQATPKDIAPADLKRDPYYVFISNRPGENVKEEISIIMGLPMKEDGAHAEVAGSNFALIAKGANAWIKNTAEEAQFVDVLTKGLKLVIRAPSLEGQLMIDSYSLAGLSQALKMVQKECP